MKRILDCSHVIEDGMVTYPGLPGPRIGVYMSRAESRSHYDAGTEFLIGTIEMVANTGTYLDTPYHRYADGYDLADLPLERAAALPGICIEAEGRTVGAGLLEDVDVAGRAVLFHTGWDQHWGTERYGDGVHPHVAKNAVALLVDRAAALVGIDSVNIDDTTGGERPAHTMLLEAGIPVVEHLTGLELLVGMDFQFFAVPPKVRGLGTFPVRAFALVE